MNNYLDNNATTIMLPEVKHILCKEILEFDALNPSSQHAAGRKAKHILDNARQNVIRAINGSLKDFDVIFTSSGTETNNTLIKGLPEDCALFISAIEHSSLLKPAQKRQNTFIIKVTTDGIIDLDDLESQLSKATQNKKITSIMLANNETGVIQNFKPIIELSKKYNALIHTDASQAFGKLPLDISSTPFDAITIASHKIGGPLGASALVKKKTLKLTPLIEGGSQENNMRAGTENLLSIVGFSEAAKLIKSTVESYKKQQNNRDYLEEKLKEIDPEIKIYAQNKPRLPNTSCISSSRFNNEIQQMHLDLENIAISAGSACASGKIDKSHVLQAMNNNDPLIKHAIRVSLGINSTKANVDHFINSWKKLYNNG